MNITVAKGARSGQDVCPVQLTNNQRSRNRSRQPAHEWHEEHPAAPLHQRVLRDPVEPVDQQVEPVPHIPALVR